MVASTSTQGAFESATFLSSATGAAVTAVPTWFGDGARQLFGWYHPPLGAPGDRVAVLCNPFGYDTMISHYSYKHLARVLSAEGVGVLRFDYYGTGDSGGDDAGPTRIEEWIASVDEARAQAQRMSGARKVALFGLRFGALMALASAQRSPVDSLVLLGPPASGKACLRELRALRKLQPPVPTPHNPEGAAPDDENFGFLMTEPMRAALGAIDPTKIARSPAKRALVIARDDVPGGEAALADHLRSLGVDSRSSTTPGYSLALRGDPYTCELPEAAWNEIAGWLATPKDESGVAPRSASPATRTTIGLDGVREELVEHRGLFGLLTRPSDLSQRRAKTAIVLLNIGANHHIGSNRMYVRWARRWASLGFSVLRFDLSGVGDSAVRAGRGEKEVYSPSATDETREVLDLLGDRGCERAVFAGLCSGAYVAFHTALADPRVAGVMLLNQPTFHWKPGDSLELVARGELGATSVYLDRALKLDTYRRALRGEVHVRHVLTQLASRLVVRLKNKAQTTAVRLGVIDEPDDVARGFQALSARGCDALVVVGSNDGARDTVVRHLGSNAEKMRGRANFRLSVFDGTDHIFTPRDSQDRLERLLTEHVVARFG